MALPNFGSLVRISGNLIDLAFSKFLSTTDDPQDVKFGIAETTGNLTVGGGINLGTATGAVAGALYTSSFMRRFSDSDNAYLITLRNMENTRDRILISASAGGAGKAGLELGSGESHPDTNLYRDSANVLKTDDSLTVVGALSKGSGSFVIPHPDKTKDTKLRHYLVESNTPGTNIYRYEVDCVAGENAFDLPDYFEVLNSNVHIHICPVKHFGRAYGKYEGNNQYTVNAELEGKYWVVIYADRKDEIALKYFERYGTEYKELEDGEVEKIQSN